MWRTNGSKGSVLSDGVRSGAWTGAVSVSMKGSFCRRPAGCMSGKPENGLANGAVRADKEQARKWRALANVLRNGPHVPCIFIQVSVEGRAAALNAAREDWLKVVTVSITSKDGTNGFFFEESPSQKSGWPLIRLSKVRTIVNQRIRLPGNGAKPETPFPQSKSWLYVGCNRPFFFLFDLY